MKLSIKKKMKWVLPILIKWVLPILIITSIAAVILYQTQQPVENVSLDKLIGMPLWLPLAILILFSSVGLCFYIKDKLFRIKQTK